MSIEIELLSTSELSERLAKRFDAIIIYGIQKNTRTNVSNYYDYYIGDQSTLIGLCELLKEKLKEDFKQNNLEEA